MRKAAGKPPFFGIIRLFQYVKEQIYSCLKTFLTVGLSRLQSSEAAHLRQEDKEPDTHCGKDRKEENREPKGSPGYEL